MMAGDDRTPTEVLSSLNVWDMTDSQITARKAQIWESEDLTPQEHTEISALASEQERRRWHPNCRVCGRRDLQDGGQDDLGHPITVCAGCGERQEEE